jgi:F0F1-type ATP synthase membrane subunit b/b'
MLKERNALIADTTLSSQERKAEIKLLMQEQKEAMREIMEETRSILGRD